MSFQSPNAKNVCPIIVTFHPQNSHINNIIQISKTFKQVIVVDNTNDKSKIPIFDKISQLDGIEIIFNEHNFGIAKALNIGTQWAITHNFQWIMTFDQDTSIDNDIMKDVSRIIGNHAQPETLGVIGINHQDLNSGELYYEPKLNSDNELINMKTVITSGSLISIDVYKKLGHFRDDFFIDGIDHEYCLRARRQKFKNVLLVKPLLIHSMGNQKIHKIPPFPFKFTTSNYPYFRWYFITRNRITLVFKYLLFEPVWSITRFIRLLVSIVFMLIWEKDRISKIKYIFLGVWDAATLNTKRQIQISQ